VECGIKSTKLSKPHGANSFIHIFFTPIVKDELGVLQQRAAAPKTTETRIYILPHVVLSL
jgi:hypothetical protein